MEIFYRKEQAAMKRVLNAGLHVYSEKRGNSTIYILFKDGRLVNEYNSLSSLTQAFQAIVMGVDGDELNRI